MIQKTDDVEDAFIVRIETGQVFQRNGLATQVRNHRQGSLEEIDDRLDWLGDVLNRMDDRGHIVAEEAPQVQLDVVEGHRRYAAGRVAAVESPLEAEIGQQLRKGIVAARPDEADLKVQAEIDV